MGQLKIIKKVSMSLIQLVGNNAYFMLGLGFEPQTPHFKVNFSTTMLLHKKKIIKENIGIGRKTKAVV